MKTIKGMIIVAIIFFSYSHTYAQTPSEWASEHKKEFNNAQYIFEGKITLQKYYRGKNQIVSTAIMQITKIYKGGPQLKLGSIKVITWQNVVHNGTLIPEEDGGRLTETSKGGTYIMFCRPANTSWLVDSTVTDNSMTLTIWGMDEVVIVYPANDSVSWYGTPQFKTTEDIDAFFQENGLTIQEQVAPADSTMKK